VANVKDPVHAMACFFAALCIMAMPLQGKETRYALFSTLLKNEPVDATGKTWVQSGMVGKTYTATLRQVEAILERNGYHELQGNAETIKGKRTKISQWSDGKTNIIFMVVELKVAETSFSWGIVPNDK